MAAMLTDRIEIDDDFMRTITRCCQCGNETRKPDRLKFLPCSHLMCIRCLDGIRSGTNQTARTPRSYRTESSLQNGRLENGEQSEKDVFMTEIGELPEGKREMYVRGFCPACEESFLVPKSNLSIFEDDFHNSSVLSRFVVGERHVCEQCLEDFKEMEAEKQTKKEERKREKKERRKQEKEKRRRERKEKREKKRKEKEERKAKKAKAKKEKEGTPPSQKKTSTDSSKTVAKKGKAPPPKKGTKGPPAKGKPAKKDERKPESPKKSESPKEKPESPKKSRTSSERSRKSSTSSSSSRSSSSSASSKSSVSSSDNDELALDLDEPNVGEFFCMGCNRFLCSSCGHRHLTPENLREHRLVPAHEYMRETQEESVFCMKHPDKRYTHFCLYEKCQRAICAVCLNQTHHDHKVEPISKVTRDPDILSEALQNSRALEMKVKLRTRELQEAKIQDVVIDTLNEEIDRLKEEFTTLLDNYKVGINARFNEVNGNIEIDEARVHSYLQKIRKMNGVLSTVLGKGEYEDQDLLILAHFLGANQDLLTNERKVEELMREKTIVVHHQGLDLGHLQAIFKSCKELPQSIPFDLQRTHRQELPLPKDLKCTSSNRLMVASSLPHTFALFNNNDIVVLDPKGKSIHKYQCVSVDGKKQHRFQYMYYNNTGKDKGSEALICPAGIGTYDGYTLVCDTAPSVRGAPKRGQLLIFDDKLRQIDAVPIDAIPHCMTSYLDQIYIGSKTKVAHYQLETEDKYNGEIEFRLKLLEIYHVGTEWWGSLTVNRDGNLAIQDGNSELYIFRDGKQVLKPSTKIRGVKGISFYGTNKLLMANCDKNTIMAYSLKEDENGHPVVDKELPSILLMQKDKVQHPLHAMVDNDGDIITTDEKGQVKLYCSPK